MATYRPIAGVSIWLPAPNPYRGVQLATFRQSVHAAAESAREDGACGDSRQAGDVPTVLGAASLRRAVGSCCRWDAEGGRLPFASAPLSNRPPRCSA